MGDLFTLFLRVALWTLEAKHDLDADRPLDWRSSSHRRLSLQLDRLTVRMYRMILGRVRMRELATCCDPCPWLCDRLAVNQECYHVVSSM